MIKWRDKKWFVGVIVLPVVTWVLTKSPSQNSIANGSNEGIATQNQVGNNVFNSVQAPHHFSDTQSIKTFSKDLGGNPILNLDNVATLRLGPNITTGQITLFLDSPAVTLPDRFFPTRDKQIPGFSVNVPPTKTGMITTSVRGDASGISLQDVTIVPDPGKSYVFDLVQNRGREVVVDGRTFVVKLIEFKILNVPGVAIPREYVFKISDK